MQGAKDRRVQKHYRNLDLRFSNNAKATAGYLVQGAGLPDWEVGFLGDALISCACTHERIREMDCISEVSQMNSIYREHLIAVIQALTGLRFECAVIPLVGDAGASEGLHVLHVEWIERVCMSRLRALTEEFGLHSDAFRAAIRKECKAMDLLRFTSSLRAAHAVQGVSHGEQHRAAGTLTR